MGGENEFLEGLKGEGVRRQRALAFFARAVKTLFAARLFLQSWVKSHEGFSRISEGYRVFASEVKAAHVLREDPKEFLCHLKTVDWIPLGQVRSFSRRFKFSTTALSRGEGEATLK